MKEPIEKQVEEVCERHSFKEKLERLGYNLSEETFNRTFMIFKEINLRRILRENDIEL